MWGVFVLVWEQANYITFVILQHFRFVTTPLSECRNATKIFSVQFEHISQIHSKQRYIYLVQIAVENMFLCPIHSANNRNKLAFIVIPVTVADKQPSPKYNEMWSIISRVGMRQFQNPPSDVMFFFPFLFFIMFLFYPFSPYTSVFLTLYAKCWLPWNRRPSALQGLRDQSRTLSSDYFLTQWK